MRTITSIITLLLLAISIHAQTFGDGGAPSVVFRGYVKEMPSLQFDRDFTDVRFTNIFHNRLNFRWNIANEWNFVAEGRNRLFYNDLFKTFDVYKEILEYDRGLMDLTWVWLSNNGWIGQTNIDRFFLNWQYNKWQVRVGRQRINWGINLVSNPNDLFNTYSFFDFDYPERPGADAIRVQYHTGFASRIELAYSPAEDVKESIGGLLWLINYKGYDIQTLAGYFHNRYALGLGWAGNIKTAGFKGEATWFYDLEETEGVDRGNLVAATSVDYMFNFGTFAVLEFLYNGGYGRNNDTVLLITQPFRPDNLMFSKYTLTLSLQHPFSSILQGQFTTMAFPDIRAYFFMPGITYSMRTNLDLELISQIFTGGKGTSVEEAGSSLFLALKYSF